MSEKTNKRNFPSVELAYPIAVNSYEVALKRLDTMDGRLQTIVVFAVSIFGGFVSFANNSELSFASFWFIIATLCCVLAAGFGIYGRLSGEVRLLKPSGLFQGWLHKEQWQFQKDLIDRAGKAFESNMALAKRKWTISVLITILLVLEVAALTVWVLAADPYKDRQEKLCPDSAAADLAASAAVEPAVLVSCLTNSYFPIVNINLDGVKKKGVISLIITKEPFKNLYLKSADYLLEM